MITLGIDAGSSSVKVSLLNAATGSTIAQASWPESEMEIISIKPGWAEQSPDVWWEVLIKALNKLFTLSKVKADEVRAVGISYQMHGLVCVDKEQRPLRSSIIWCDSRAVETGNKAFHELSEEKCMNRLLNSPGNFTASKLKWVMENEPETYSKIDKIMLPGEYLAMRLTGRCVTTASGLSEGIMWDFRESKQASFLLDYYGISEGLLPDLVNVFEVQGLISKKGSDETGLPEGIPITYRAGDQPNNALSLNCLEPGEIASTAGTSGVVYGISNNIKSDPLGRVNTFAHVNHSLNDSHLGVLLCINGCGISYSWIRRLLYSQNDSYNELNIYAESVKPGSEGLCFIPFGNGAERMLQNNTPGAGFSNINYHVHCKEHFLRAVTEGVAYAFYYGIEVLKELNIVPSVIRAGNANLFQSSVFRNTLSALSGASIQLYNTDGSLGAARGAAYGAGYFSSLKEAFSGLEVIKTIEPDEENRVVYRETYEIWKKFVKLSTRQSD